MTIPLQKSAILLGAALLPICAGASSHREAPAIAGMPQVDGTDFYLFRSYESGRSGFVTLIANYLPAQDPGGGPNFYNLSTDAIYSIHVDNNGDSKDDMRFDFKFSNTIKDLKVPANGKNVAIPLINDGAIDWQGANANVTQSYTVDVSRSGWGKAEAKNASKGGETFQKPVDNIGNKSIPDYAAYAAHFVWDITIPDCSTPGRVFVGQRKEGFVVNLAEVFDLVNLNPAGPRDGETNTLSGKNVTSIALEVPISCLTSRHDPVIGGYTTASYSLGGKGPMVQVSRVGAPLVNELVIGLPDKDKFNGSSPSQDAQFLDYVTNPTLPVLLHALFGPAALVPESPRNDLVAAFLTGVKGLNQPVKPTPAEMIRLNTKTPVTPSATQNDLGVLGGDLAGFPNGRRPYDDVVDIELRVAEGALCGAIGDCGSQKADPNNGAPYTDESRSAGPDAQNLTLSGKIKATDTYLDVFPYLNTPIPGSPNAANGVDGTIVNN